MRINPNDLLICFAVHVPRLSVPDTKHAWLLRGVRAHQVLVETSENQGELEDSISSFGSRSVRTW